MRVLSSILGGGCYLKYHDEYTASDSKEFTNFELFCEIIVWKGKRVSDNCLDYNNQPFEWELIVSLITNQSYFQIESVV